jgi:hypothetical protein
LVNWLKFESNWINELLGFAATAAVPSPLPLRKKVQRIRGDSDDTLVALTPYSAGVATNPARGK